MLYEKGDLDFDGHVDRRDWRRFLRGLRRPWLRRGWRHLLDLDRDGDLDLRDLRLFERRGRAGHGRHPHQDPL